MLEKYFKAPKTLHRLRSGPAGQYIDGFAGILKERGYAYATAVRYLRSASHLAWFVRGRRGSLESIDDKTLVAYGRHLPRCRCPKPNGGKVNHHMLFGAKLFVEYGATQLLDNLGSDTSGYDAKSVRDFFQQRIEQISKSSAQHLGTAIRAFLKYLGVHGYCQPDLDRAIPSLANCRLASLPQYLTPKQIQLILYSCAGNSDSVVRDRAIILLLIQLG